MRVRQVNIGSGEARQEKVLPLSSPRGTACARPRHDARHATTPRVGGGSPRMSPVLPPTTFRHMSSRQHVAARNRVPPSRRQSFCPKPPSRQRIKFFHIHCRRRAVCESHAISALARKFGVMFSDSRQSQTSEDMALRNVTEKTRTREGAHR